MHQGRVVEARMDEDLGDVDLLVPQRLGRRADVILAEPDLQDLADVGGEREAGTEATESLSLGLTIVPCLGVYLPNPQRLWHSGSVHAS